MAGKKVTTIRGSFNAVNQDAEHTIRLFIIMRWIKIVWSEHLWIRMYFGTVLIGLNTLDKKIRIINSAQFIRLLCWWYISFYICLALDFLKNMRRTTCSNLRQLNKYDRPGALFTLRIQYHNGIIYTQAQCKEGGRYHAWDLLLESNILDRNIIPRIQPDQKGSIHFLKP